MKKIAALLLTVSSICFGNEGLELLIGPEKISEKIAEVAAVIDQEYNGEELTVIMVMKGAVCVASDLIRQLKVPCTIEYMKASSYGKNGTHRGELKITGLDNVDLSSKHVLVVDDIFDTGNTMSAIVNRLKEANPKSLKSLVLLKKNVTHHTDYRPDYTLFEIEDRFVVGFGLDYKEYFRGLPGIYAFINDTPPN